MKFNSLIKVTITSIFSIFLLSGCSYVESNVVVFHKLPKIEKEKKVEYSFLKLEGQENSLEYDTYQEKIKQHLIKNNYFENSNSNLLISFKYGIDNGKEQIGSMPIIGQTGVSSSYTTGTVNSYGGSYGSYSGTTTYTPTYGVVGSSTYSETVYKRFLNLFIYDKTEKKIIYEGSVISSGSSASINSVIDEMMDSLFEDFPGESGKTKTVNKPFVE